MKIFFPGNIVFETAGPIAFEGPEGAKKVALKAGEKLVPCPGEENACPGLHRSPEGLHCGLTGHASESGAIQRCYAAVLAAVAPVGGAVESRGA